MGARLLMPASWKYVSIALFGSMVLFYLVRVGQSFNPILTNFRWWQEAVATGEVDEMSNKLPAEYPTSCINHRFESIHIISRKPFTMLIEGFLSPLEAQILVKAA